MSLYRFERTGGPVSNERSNETCSSYQIDVMTSLSQKKTYLDFANGIFTLMLSSMDRDSTI